LGTFRKTVKSHHKTVSFLWEKSTPEAIITLWVGKVGVTLLELCMR
jgi:hypothetical protein